MSAGEKKPSDIAVKIGDLRIDALRWTEYADQVQEARNVLSRVVLTVPQVSKHAADIAALHGTLAARYSSLLDDAAENFRNIATALRAAADQYEAEEKRGLHAILKNW